MISAVIICGIVISSVIVAGVISSRWSEIVAAEQVVINSRINP